jgi:Na+/melibiose symporter-like transporter
MVHGVFFNHILFAIIEPVNLVEEEKTRQGAFIHHRIHVTVACYFGIILMIWHVAHVRENRQKKKEENSIEENVFDRFLIFHDEKKSS